MSTEFEIKLEVPAACARAVRAAMKRLNAKTDRLRAIYYDTPERLLQRERFALRTRFEQGRWMQTLKGEGAQAHERLEHSVAISRARGTPRPSLARHADSDAGTKLARLLGEGFDDAMWEPLFETDVERATVEVEEDGSTVEIAFDRGRVVAGPKEAALCEIEFELKRGEARAAVDIARRWCARYELTLSTISKAHKGARLVKGEPWGEPATAREARFPRHASLRRIAGEALASSLDQVMANASELAAGSREEEHVHQVRVGIRRARTALRELVGADCASQEEALVHAFRELGKHRDVHHVLETLAPKLRASGGPVPAEAPMGRSTSPARIVSAPAFQDALLSLLGTACELRSADASAHGVKDEIQRRLDRLHRKSLKDGVRFESLDSGRQHRVRKRLKRLRYLAEFTAPLLDESSEKYLDSLKKAQDALGEYNDEVTVLAHYRTRAADADAWFAIGWLEADRARLARECTRLLRKFAKTYTRSHGPQIG